MIEYQIHKAQADREADYSWVCLHFSTAQAKDDRILIMCATSVDEQDDPLGMNGIYLERLDQIQSGYRLATTIRVTQCSVEIELTARGSRELEFPGSLRLLWSSTVDGYESAQEHFADMAQCEYGGIVKVESSFGE